MLHLGMSGSVRMLSKNNVGAPGKHDHIDLVFTLKEEQWLLRYNDPRRFGSLLFVGPRTIDSNQLIHPLLEKLGPEPLSDDFDANLLFTLSRKRNVAIKNFIMNGHVVVGVGNIYASESLFMSGIKPMRPAGKVTRAEYEKLTSAIKQILAKAIQVGGTTLRDFTGSDGKAGYFQQTLNVYERDKDACVNCGTIIKRIVIGQRSSFYCSRCQK
jgi:formamidopyrimidine-DNA glycosylase